MPAVSNFPPALPNLQAALPQWFAAEDPSSELYKVLAAGAKQMDAAGLVFDDVSAGRSLLTCSDADLYDQYAFLYGLQGEQAPPTPAALRGLLLALAAFDGTTPGLLRVLVALVTSTANLMGGTVLTFPGGGGGLTFPANGTGLMMYQFAPGAGPPLTATLGFVFPVDGTALVFAADGSGLTFPTAGILNVIEPVDPQALFPLNQVPAYTYTVQVSSWLAFDRPTFSRLVNRLRIAHLAPPVIQETP